MTLSAAGEQKRHGGKAELENEWLREKLAESERRVKHWKATCLEQTRRLGAEESQSEKYQFNLMECAKEKERLKARIAELEGKDQ